MSEQALLELIAEARATGEPWTAVWADRTRALIDDPSGFDYDDWCGYGLARN